MKQATNPFAPVPLWRKRLPGYAAMGVATIALAVGLTTLQSARTTVAGTLLPVSETDAAAYGISAVYQLDDGSYRVEGSQKGFQSDVQAAVTIDAEGNVSAVEILSQDETETLGGQCVNPEFTSQYQGAAPFTLAGKSYTVTDPVTGAAYAAAGAAEEQPAAAGDFDPAQWRAFDTSPEAEATRKMYAAGLTLSALKGEALGDELAPPLDSSAEAEISDFPHAEALKGKQVRSHAQQERTGRRADGDPLCGSLGRGAVQGASGAGQSDHYRQCVRCRQRRPDRGGRPFRRDHHLFGCDDHRQQLVFLCDRGTLRRVTSTEEWNLWQKLIS